MKEGNNEIMSDSDDNAALSRLNKYISNAGICSRRAADDLIKEGRVRVNGKVTKEMGVKVGVQDVVTVDSDIVKSEAKLYVLVNKPKNVICTKKDEKNRKSIMDLLPAKYQHLYPVGRLDRNTTGVILLTNDGDLTQNLLHPKKKIKKIYKAKSAKPLSENDLDKMKNGVDLEDGVSKFDKISELREDEFNRYGIEMHSGKNRVIRRMFEAVGNEVIKLDRVMFHTFDKRKISQGSFRELTAKELKNLGVYLRTSK